jgi:hypothetical protein
MRGVFVVVTLVVIRTGGELLSALLARTPALECSAATMNSLCSIVCSPWSTVIGARALPCRYGGPRNSGHGVYA